MFPLTSSTLFAGFPLLFGLQVEACSNPYVLVSFVPVQHQHMKHVQIYILSLSSIYPHSICLIPHKWKKSTSPELPYPSESRLIPETTCMMTMTLLGALLLLLLDLYPSNSLQPLLHTWPLRASVCHVPCHLSAFISLGPPTQRVPNQFHRCQAPDTQSACCYFIFHPWHVLSLRNNAAVRRYNWKAA